MNSACTFTPIPRRSGECRRILLKGLSRLCRISRIAHSALRRVVPQLPRLTHASKSACFGRGLPNCLRNEGQELRMSVVPHSGATRRPAPEEAPRRSGAFMVSPIPRWRTKAETAGALAASREASTKAAELQRDGRAERRRPTHRRTCRQDGDPDETCHRDRGRGEQDRLRQGGRRSAAKACCPSSAAPARWCGSGHARTARRRTIASS